MRIEPVGEWRAGLWRAGLCALLAIGCAREEAPSAPPPPAVRPTEVASAPVGRPAASDAERQAIERAREAGQHLGRTLRTRLMAAMAEGPDAAVRVCADEAQALTAQAAEERGARVGRTSTRLRNPANAGPDWARAWLVEQGDRAAADLAPRSLIVDGIDGQPAAARFVAPIAVEGPCVLCHGPPAGIPESVRAVLSERYPDDRGTGYQVGDLRGALWAEVPVTP